MEVCQRCLSKPISFQCTVCPSYRNLCTRCDNIIHNISSKQDHRRIAINQTKSSQELKQENNILDNKILYCFKQVGNNISKLNKHKKNREIIKSTNLFEDNSDDNYEEKEEEKED